MRKLYQHEWDEISDWKLKRMNHSEQEILEQEWYWNRPLRTTNIYYRLWFLRRKIRPLLPWLIG